MNNDKDEVFSELIPSMFPMFDILNDTELIADPFKNGITKQLYKVIDLVKEPKVKYSIENNHLVIIIEGEGGKFFRVKIDSTGIEQIKSLLSIHEQPNSREVKE